MLNIFKRIFFNEFILVCALLTSILFIAYPDFFLLKSGLLMGDHFYVNYPFSFFLYKHLQTSQLPLWTNLIGCGFPIFAEGQIACLYPLNFLFSKIIPVSFHFAYNYFTILHILIGGISIYYYCRNLRITRTGAYLAAFVFIFGICQGGYFLNSNSQRIVALFPLVLLLLDRFFNSGRFLFLLLVGMIVGIQINSGHPQTLMYCCMFAGLYYFIAMFYKPFKKGAFQTFKQVLFHALAIGAPALLIGLPQMLATMELVGFSNRLGLSKEFAYMGSMLPSSFFTFIFPFFNLKILGSVNLYSGTFSLFLLIVAWRTHAKWPRELHSLFWIGCLSVAIALGRFNPVYILFVKISHFNSLRVPSRAIYFLGFSLAVFSGWGWDRLLQVTEKTQFRKSAFGFSIIAGAAIVCCVAAGMLFKHAEPGLKMLGLRIIEKYFVGNSLHPYPVAAYKAKLDNLLQIMNSTFSLSGNKMLGLGIIFFAINIFLINIWARVSLPWKKLWLHGLGAVLLAELFFFRPLGFLQSQISSYSEHRKLGETFASELANEKNSGRIFEYLTDPSQREFFPFFFNANLLYPLQDVGIYSPLALESHRAFFNGLGANDNSLTLHVAGDRQSFVKLRPLLDVSNVRYILSLGKLEFAGLEERFANSDYYLYENKNVLPRAFWMPAEVVVQVRNFNEYVRKADFDPRREILLENKTAFGAHEMSSRKVNVLKPVSLSDSGEKLTIVSQYHAPGIIFLSDIFYPGWQAFVNGKPASILRADGLFRAITVPPGRVELEFVYNPFYKKFLWIPGFVLLLSVFAAIGLQLKKTRKSTDGE